MNVKEINYNNDNQLMDYDVNNRDPNLWTSFSLKKWLCEAINPRIHSPLAWCLSFVRRRNTRRTTWLSILLAFRHVFHKSSKTCHVHVNYEASCSIVQNWHRTSVSCGEPSVSNTRCSVSSNIYKTRLSIK